MLTLALSTVTADRRLGRLIGFDHRSKNYPVRGIVCTKIPVSRTWECRTVLDQGQEGSCTGNAFCHELICEPEVYPCLTEEDAVKIYKTAQDLDPWPGNNYSGTTVLAAVKATMKIWPGVYDSYRWAFDISDVIQTLSFLGPVVLGISWHAGMYAPNSIGVIEPTGPVMGGHAILARGVDMERGLIMLRNSWGSSYGISGDCYITFENLEKLLHEGGEACVPVGRHLTVQP